MYGGCFLLPHGLLVSCLPLVYFFFIFLSVSWTKLLLARLRMTQLVMSIPPKLLRRQCAENLWIFYTLFCAILSFRWNYFMPYISGRKFQIRPLRHRGFHNRYHWWCNRGFNNKWLCNKRLKQFVRSRFQLQIDQVIFQTVKTALKLEEKMK